MILSTVPDNGFEEMPGTSMASPMVAGVVETTGLPYRFCSAGITYRTSGSALE